MEGVGVLRDSYSVSGRISDCSEKEEKEDHVTDRTQDEPYEEIPVSGYNKN